MHRRRSSAALPLALFAGLALAALTPQAAAAKCQVNNFAQMQTSMVGPRAMVQGTVNGQPVRFIIDSGAFYSTLSPSAARELKLELSALPDNFRLSGIGGSTFASLAKVHQLGLAGASIRDVPFIVAGTDTGVAGLIGQNVLGLHDVEYDLEHGMVRLMQTKDCGNVGLAYWANGRPFSMLTIETPEEYNPHTIATVLVNGQKMRALFDSGAPASSISPSAAQRAGVTINTPGAVAAGTVYGMGSKQLANWQAPFDSIDIGGELIHHPTLNVHDHGGDVDMIIGMDFFLTHRIFVSNNTRRMYFTYDGGPVFGIAPRRAVTAAGDTIALTDTGAEPVDAAGYSARGTAFASKGDMARALADLDRAIEKAPAEPRYFDERARIHQAMGERPAALQDAAKAVALAPSDVPARLLHAAFAAGAGDRAAALADATAADQALSPEAPDRLQLAGLFNTLDAPETAIKSYDQWLHFHSEDGTRASAFNGRCWSRAMLNRDLDKALSDCNTAIRLKPDSAAYLDSRGLVHLRRGEYTLAVDDYAAALKIDPRLALSLYGRSVAEARLGQSAAAAQDRTAALAANPLVAQRAARLGL